MSIYSVKLVLISKFYNSLISNKNKDKNSSSIQCIFKEVSLLKVNLSKEALRISWTLFLKIPLEITPLLLFVKTPTPKKQKKASIEKPKH